MPNRLRARNNLLRRFELIRVLRNRVFYYEPIWARSGLVDDHEAILEAIAWMNPDVANAVRAIDRFVIVYSGGAQAMRVLLTSC